MASRQIQQEQQPWLLENGHPKVLTKESRQGHGRSRTAHNMSSSSLRKKSDRTLVSKIGCASVRNVVANIQEVILGTKLSILFPAIPAAIIAHYLGLGRSWVFILSLLGLTPLAERVSFLTEQIAIFTGPTVGGLLNATCGNVTELIIAVFALTTNKIAVVKYSLLGSVLSNLLLVLGTSLLCGGIANIRVEQKYDRRQADVNSLMLLLALLCHLLPLLFTYSAALPELTVEPSLYLSRASSIVMLVAYFAYLIFQLWTHRQLFEAEDEGEGDNNEAEEEAVIGFWSGFAWLAGMTVFIALLSEYVVDTIEDASDSWGLSVSFLSIILLPIVGNAAEHAGAIIFAFKNKLDISLGVALGSSTQIAMFVVNKHTLNFYIDQQCGRNCGCNTARDLKVLDLNNIENLHNIKIQVPLCVTVSWAMGVNMDLNFNLLETGSLAVAIIVTSFTLQDGTSHYMKGIVLLLCYFVIAACFFVQRIPNDPNGVHDITLKTLTDSVISA